MSGKGDRNRTTDTDRYRQNHARVFKPKAPFYEDIQRCETNFINCGEWSVHTESHKLCHAGSTPAPAPNT